MLDGIENTFFMLCAGWKVSLTQATTVIKQQCGWIHFKVENVRLAFEFYFIQIGEYSVQTEREGVNIVFFLKKITSI